MASDQPEDETVTQEERIMRMMKRVLTDIAKDTHTPPGMRHPLSEQTVQGIKDCLALISARERELAEAGGRPMNMRPRFIDEPRDTVSVPLDPEQLRKKPGGEHH